MNIQRWIARKEPNWKQLETLLQKTEKKGLPALSAAELRSLSSLYRAVSADLARARTYQVGHTLVQSLQRLTGRAYSQIYQGYRRQNWQGAIDFYRRDFPQVVQETLPYTMLATAIFGLAGLVAWWFSWRDPAFMELIVPEHIVSLVRDQGKLWMGAIMDDSPGGSSSIMVNNLTVSFRVVAGGITAGLLTTWALIINGLLIGAIATLIGQNNLAYPFWAFVLPHGSLELPAIFFAGGAGFLIAKALLFPGQYRRMDAFKVYGMKAAQQVYGIVPMLVIAGVIEGFFSPNPAIPAPIKYLVGMILLVGLIAYCSQTVEGEGGLRE